MTAAPTRPELIPPCATCGHPMGLHHLTTSPPRVRTWCTVHNPGACTCKQYVATGGGA